MLVSLSVLSKVLLEHVRRKVKLDKNCSWQCAIAFEAPLLHLMEEGFYIVGVEPTAVEPEAGDEIAFAPALVCVCHGFSGGS